MINGVFNLFIIFLLNIELVINILSILKNNKKYSLDLLFIFKAFLNKKIGTAAWLAIEANYPDARIVLFAPVWRKTWERERPLVKFRDIPQIFERIAEEVGNADVVDCFGFIPQDNACFSPDVLHPNDTGFAHYAKGVKAALEERNLL